MHAQFIVVPALTKVQEIFIKATDAHGFHDGVEWFSWIPLEISNIETFRPYIRPSHQKLINDAVADPENGGRICSFLRQLLRPHQFKIETRSGPNKSWMLISTIPVVADASGGEVHRHAGMLVIW